MELTPITIQDANILVKRWHRHHRPVVSALFAVACSEGDEIVGAAIIGRPVARVLQDGYTAEVVRVVTNGYPNAASMLLGAAWRACRSLGYRRLVTYTLAEEGGTSLRGAGYTCVGKAGGGSWSRSGRPRVDAHPTQQKIRWERVA
jgi:hypothetical protein